MQKTVCLPFALIAQVCDGHHPFQLSDMSKNDQDLLFGHMIKNKSGYICSSMATRSGVVIDDKFKAVLGNASKRTWSGSLTDHLHTFRPVWIHLHIPHMEHLELSRRILNIPSF